MPGKISVLVATAVVGAALASGSAARASGLTRYTAHAPDGASWVFTSDSAQKLRVTPYGDRIVRVQVREAGEPFGANDRYEMVQSHTWSGKLAVTEDGSSFRLAPPDEGPLELRVTKQPLGIRLAERASGRVLFETSELGNGSRPLEVKVNGTVAAASVSLARTASWDAWSTTSALSVQLHAGENTIRATSVSAAGPNVDSISVGEGRYEAENATLSGAAVATDHGGFTGSGFADFVGAAGAFIEWHVTVPAAGTYPLTIRYANMSKLGASFVPHAEEHFAGLGHGPYGRVDRLDLKGSVVHRSRGGQSPLFVPFWLSSYGYGVFLDDTYPLTVSFLDTDYSVSADGGALDFFVVLGPELPKVLDRYTELTGRPRLPPIAAFGLGLSDKASNTGPDGQGLLVSDEAWWKDKIERMRKLDIPFDVVIHDNSWRNAKTGPWTWDQKRYPDPKEYESWCRSKGVVNMLDFNRADASYSKGWQPSFALPGTPDGGERGGWPDFSRADVRSWFWKLLYDETFDPQRGYPGDFLWLDEPDEDVTPTAPLGNGRTWDEMGAYYFFLLAKAVGEGWDHDIGAAKRPYFMARGMTAGAQRWASLWSGDIEASYPEMKQQIRGMLAAGLSGFPYWAHDAGGFHPQSGPSLPMYRNWALAMGSFSPIWKPHGPGFRFPWDKYAPEENDARLYAKLRMELLPYLYSYAHAAHTTGMPMARPLFLEYPNDADAWSRDLEYLWGHELLVAPATTDSEPVDVWLPKGTWYGFWDEARALGPSVVSAPADKMPIFVRAGAILPRAHAMASTASWDRSTLVLDVYAGADGSFELVEDDGISERFQTGEKRTTPIRSLDATRTIEIGPAAGTFANPNDGGMRKYEVRIHGLAAPLELAVDGVATKASWDAAKKVLSLTTAPLAVDARVTIAPPAPPHDGTPTMQPTPPGGGAADGAEDSGGCACRAVAPREDGAPSPWAALVAASALTMIGSLRRRNVRDRSHRGDRGRAS